jgi:ABC-type branched-subunit amino acid transport system ATPase component
VRAAAAVADRVYVLSDGRVVFTGSSAEFAADEVRVETLAGARASKRARTVR